MKKKIGLNTIKIQNISSVFDTIAVLPATRSEIAKAIGVSLMTVSNITELLLYHNLIEIKAKVGPIKRKNLEAFSKNSGRRPEQLSLNAKARSFIILNISSGKDSSCEMWFAHLDLSLSTVYISNIKIADVNDFLTEFDSFLAIVGEYIIKNCKVNATSIGLLSPGPYITETDRIHSSKINMLNNIEIKKYISQKLSEYFKDEKLCDIFIDENVKFAAKCCALVYEQFKNGIGIYINISESMGGSIILSGDVFRGSKGLSGNVGDMIFENGISYEKKLAGNACKNVDEAVKIVFTLLKNLVCLIDPDIIVVDSILSEKFNDFDDKMQKEIKNIPVNIVKRKTGNPSVLSKDINLSLMGAGYALRERLVKIINS